MTKKKNLAGSVLVYVLLIGLTVLTLTPLIWMLSASLKLDNCLLYTSDAADE